MPKNSIRCCRKRPADTITTSPQPPGLEGLCRPAHVAEALILQFPTWCFGLPAMLKGFFDRMIMPGVAFDLSDPAHAKPMLRNIKRIVGIVTYGRPRYMALWMSDPPRKIVKRYVRWFTRWESARRLLRALSPQCRHRRAACGVHGQGRARMRSL